MLAVFQHHDVKARDKANSTAEGVARELLATKKQHYAHEQRNRFKIPFFFLDWRAQLRIQQRWLSKAS